MAKYFPEIKVLLKAANNYLLPIHHGKGFNKSAFDDLCDAIRACTARWADADAIPKTLASVLVGLYPEADPFGARYLPDQAKLLLDAALQIDRLVNECVQGSEAESSWYDL